VVQELPQAGLFPGHTNGAQLGLPGPVTLLQTPSLVDPAATEQASQGPPQTELQQTPSMQKVLPHSLPPPHARPIAFLGTQAVPLQ
jgi:hypothetical protein